MPSDSTPRSIDRATLHEALQGHVSPEGLRWWFKDLRLEAKAEAGVTLSFSNSFTCDYVKNHAAPAIRRALLECGIPTTASLAIALREPGAAPLDSGESDWSPEDSSDFAQDSPLQGRTASSGIPSSLPRLREVPPPQSRSFSGPALNPQHRLSTFELDSNNRLAAAAAEALASGDRHLSGPVVAIHGNVGLGKTHLLQGAVMEFGQRHPDKRAHYTTAEQFLNDFLRALGAKTHERFRNEFRTMGLLAIDDLQVLIGKQKTQDELVHTIDAILDRGGSVLIASDRPPKELLGLTERLRERFSACMQARLERPTDELRLAIVRRRAAQLGCDLDEAVVRALGNSGATTPRELVGHVTQVIGCAALEDRPIDPTSVREILLRSGRSTLRSATFDSLLREVSHHFQVAPVDLRGKSRVRKICQARHVLCFLAKEHLQVSLQEIGRSLGGRDHSTILYACDKVRQMVEQDEELRRELDSLAENARRL